jgi:hypothetical protein
MGYSADAWHDFAMAVAGASAALAGLLFVAVSINLTRILSFPKLPSRAGQTLIMLVTPLIISVLILIPQDPDALGAELLAGAAVLVLPLARLNGPSTRTEEERLNGYLLTRVGPAAIVVAFLAVAGATLVAGVGGGLYWFAPVVLVAIVAGLGNAWVLLVEILR